MSDFTVGEAFFSFILFFFSIHEFLYPEKKIRMQQKWNV